MFAEVLREVVDCTQGAQAGILMDFEGIAVDQYTRVASPFDIETVGAEFSVILKSVRRAAESLQAGETMELAVQSKSVIAVIRILNGTYFVAVTLDPDGNIGKARYLLRVAAPKLLAELS